MASKVLVGLPQHVPFHQGSRRSTVQVVDRIPNNPELRVKLLEQNIKYLQEQHQLMLTSLHREVEALTRRNRDLQLQIIFYNSSSSSTTRTPGSSPEEESGSVQVQLLERDLAKLKTNLTEARNRNKHLQSLVDDQKKALQSAECGDTQLLAVGSRIPAASNEPHMLRDKLEEADRLIQRLRRENEEQRQEIISLRANGNGDKSRGHHNRNQQHQQQTFSRFPPLQTANKHKSASEPEINPILPPLVEANGNHRYRGGKRTYRNNHRNYNDSDN